MGRLAKSFHETCHAGTDASAIGQLLARSRPYDMVERRQHAPVTPRAFLADEVSSLTFARQKAGGQLGFAFLKPASSSKSQLADGVKACIVLATMFFGSLLNTQNVKLTDGLLL